MCKNNRKDISSRSNRNSSSRKLEIIVVGVVPLDVVNDISRRPYY